ncbi:MAG: hypothetical protein CMJ18_28110 [Phycisphaeraceae bacterium]|nr:hypothetical protein [Phycisphaeraceae bacterium]
MSVDEFINRERTWMRSASMLPRAARLTPPGSQTNAKAPLELQLGAGPNFFERADGARVWDVDGNEYIDFQAALGPIILGHRHPVIDKAVSEQLQRGVLFSLPCPLEARLAGTLVSIFGWAAWARFFKSGSDANTAAVRLARARTGRSVIISCAYNAWDDWWLGKHLEAPSWARTAGVPANLAGLVHDVPYGDTSALELLVERHADDLAGLVLAPALEDRPLDATFLRRARELADAHGAVLVLDEVKMGFRLGLRGGHGIADVEPDLAVFAKAMANGYPIAALVGTEPLAEDLRRTFITGTYNGEMLSMAAAVATLEILQQGEVYDHLHDLGTTFMADLARVVRETGLPARVGGHPAVFCLVFDRADDDRSRALQRRFFVELIRQGVFSCGSFELSAAHRREDVEIAITAARRTAQRVE